MTYAISITGIDGCGKTSSMSKLIDILSTEKSLIKFARDDSHFINPNTNEKKDIFLPDLDGDLRQKKYNCFNGLSKIIGQIKYSGIVQKALHSFEPEVALFERDPTIDSSVYSMLFFPHIRKIPIEYRIGLSQIISQSKLPDSVIYLDIDPELAYERIIKRCELNNEKPHFHENLKTLNLIRDNYERSIEYLDSRINVDRISVDNKSLDDVVVELGEIARKRL